MKDIPELSRRDDGTSATGGPVIVVVPPFHPVDISSVLCGVLKSALAERRIACTVLYTNKMFQDMTGAKLACRLAGRDCFDVMGERIFSASAFGPDAPADDGLPATPFFLESFRERMQWFERETGGLAGDPLTRIEYESLKLGCAHFIDAVTRVLVGGSPAVIAFMMHGDAVNAAVAMARAARKALPGALLVAAGPGCGGEMGDAIAEMFPVFDLVFQGEADINFSRFCEEWLTRRNRPAERVVRCGVVPDLDLLPQPDHSDFIGQVGNDPSVVPGMAFEIARGCGRQGGERCSFFAHDFAGGGYRAKTPRRVATELCTMAEHYPSVSQFCAVDPLFPPAPFSEYFDKLAECGFKGAISCDVRPELTFEQLRRMRDAGVRRLSSGIESFSSRLLGLLNKGSDAIDNVRFLRDCRELGIECRWNMLAGIPGDRIADYEEQARLLPCLEHLAPPRLRPVTIERFSPYHESPERYGLRDVRPVGAYNFAFPSFVRKEKIARYFDARFPSESRERSDALDIFILHLINWNKAWDRDDPPGLWLREKKKDLWIVSDSREFALRSENALDWAKSVALEHCRNPLSADEIDDMESTIKLVDLGYVVEIDGRFISVVCRAGGE